MRKQTSARAGFTLIEVMIALAIFVVGAVAIVRIFPPALAAIQKSQDRTNASRLASSQLERFNPRGNISSVPDAIHNGFKADGITYDDSFAGAFNGTINSNESLPRDTRGTQVTAFDKGRYVDGERQRVMKDVGGNLFVLTNFPYTLNSIKLSQEDRIEGARLEFDGANYYFNFTNATYASDGKSASAGGAPNSARYPKEVGADIRYYISYRWKNSANRVSGVNDEPYVISSIDTTSFNDLKPVRDGVTGITPLVGEVDVRVVRTIAAPDKALPDPDPSSFDYLRGVYVFGPTVVSAGDIVRVSYEVRAANDVSAWRGLIVDQTPTANGAVTLTTRGLDEDFYGDEVYALTYAAPSRDGDTKAPLRRGECIPDANGDCDDSTVDALKLITNSGNETNRVEFEVDSKGVGGLTAPRARIAYRPQNGWGVQTAVAARSYMPSFVKPTAPSSTSFQKEEWREYSWQSGTAFIYFQPSEAGKTILVSYEYEFPVGSSTYYTVRDAIVTLSNDLDKIGEVSLVAGFVGSGGKVAHAELIDPNGNLDPNITAIISIRGLSVQARTVWADNTGRYSQAVVTDYRKRS